MPNDILYQDLVFSRDLNIHSTEINLLVDKQIEFENRIKKLENTIKRLVSREEI